MTPEGRELAKVKKWLKEASLDHIRMALMPGVPRGWPDLLILPPGGMPIWVEMKRAGEKPNPKQLERLDTLKRLQYIHGWFDNADDAIEFIRHNTAALLAALRQAGAA